MVSCLAQKMPKHTKIFTFCRLESKCYANHEIICAGAARRAHYISEPCLIPREKDLV